MYMSSRNEGRSTVPGRSRLGLVAVAVTAAALLLVACESDELAVPDLDLTFGQGDAAVPAGDTQLSEIVSAGKPVVVNFWAALCGPCRLEMPDIQRIYDARADEVTILGVDIGPQWQLGSREQGEEFLMELGITYPAGVTFDPEVNVKFEIFGMPTTVFIDADGRLVRSWTGALTEAKMNELIDELIAG